MSDTQLCRCGKVGFPNRAAATAVAKVMGKRKLPRRRRGHRRVVAMRNDMPREIHAYACPISGMWHVGHKRKERGDGKSE